MSLHTMFSRLHILLGRQKKPGPVAGDVCSLFVDTYGDDVSLPDHREMMQATSLPLPVPAPGWAGRGQRVNSPPCSPARWMATPTLSDLEEMSARIEHKMRHLPEGYRERLLPFVREQIFEAHHRLLVLARNGGSADLEEAPDPAITAYFAMVEEACRARGRAGPVPAHSSSYRR